MPPVLRPLALGELLDHTFQLYRKKFLLFVGITAVPYLIVLVLQLLVQSAAFVTPGSAFGTAAIWGGIAAFVIGMIFFLAAYAVSQAATAVAVSEIYLGRDVTVSGAYKRVRGSMVRLTLIVFGIGMLTGLGFVLLIAPGIYLMLTWALAIPAAIIEDLGFAECRDRSKALVEGARGRIFVIFILVLMLSYAVAFGLQFPIVIAAMIATGGKMTQGVQIISQVASFVSSSLIGPLGMIAFTLAYYDQRVRKEGFDIQLMMSSQMQASAAAAGDSGTAGD